jgi:hypothetical protein
MGNSPSINSSSIQQQILAGAKFYPPLVYDILSRYGSLQTQPDSLSDQYIPITDVLPPASNQTLPFDVGFIPPSATIPQNTQTSRGLVNSVATSTPAPIGSLRAQLVATGGLPIGGTNFTPNPPGANGGPPTYQTYSAAQVSGMIYQTMLAQTGTPPSNETVWMLTAQTFKETGPGNGTVNWPNNNPGFLNKQSAANSGNGSLVSGTFVVSGGNQPWASFPTPQAGVQTFANTALISTPAATAAAAGDVNGYVTALGKEGYYNAYTDPKTGQLVDYDAAQAIYLSNFQALYTGAQGAAPNPSAINVSSIIGGPATAVPVNSDVSNSSGWQAQNGTGNAQTAAQQATSVANTSLNTSTSQGTQFLSQQNVQANALTNLINQMASTPPLRLLVNPRSFKNSMEKIISDGNWGRNGPIIEHWGENLDKIEGAGKIAAFYALDVQQTPINGSACWPGLTRTARNYSASYQNFLSLYLIYRSNAGLWTQDYINPSYSSSEQWSGPLNLAMLGSVYIYYDNLLYIGSFDTFTISESDEAPFSLEYSFTFTVRAWFELDQQQDPELAWNAPVNGQAAPGIQPQPGLIPTQSTISQFGPSAGQGLTAATSAVQGAVAAPVNSAVTKAFDANFGGA